jgi:hypothetical protein
MEAVEFFGADETPELSPRVERSPIKQLFESYRCLDRATEFD